MKKKLINAIVCMTMVATMIAGCGNKKEAPVEVVLNDVEVEDSAEETPNKIEESEGVEEENTEVMEEDNDMSVSLTEEEKQSMLSLMTEDELETFNNLSEEEQGTYLLFMMLSLMEEALDDSNADIQNNSTVTLGDGTILDAEGNVISDNSQNGSMSDNWKDYQVAINGTVLTLPCTYSELSTATGAELKSSEAKSYIQGGYYTTASLYKDDSLAMYIELSNSTEEEQLYTDCMVTKIGYSQYTKENLGAEIVFCGNLQIGQAMTVDDIKAILGEPQDTYEYTDMDYVSTTLRYEDESIWMSSYNSYNITIVNGVIDDISLKHLAYE